MGELIRGQSYAGALLMCFSGLAITARIMACEMLLNVHFFKVNFIFIFCIPCSSEIVYSHEPKTEKHPEP